MAPWTHWKFLDISTGAPRNAALKVGDNRGIIVLPYLSTRAGGSEINSDGWSSPFPVTVSSQIFGSVYRSILHVNSNMHGCTFLEGLSSILFLRCWYTSPCIAFEARLFVSKLRLHGLREGKKYTESVIEETMMVKIWLNGYKKNKRWV